MVHLPTTHIDDDDNTSIIIVFKYKSDRKNDMRRTVDIVMADSGIVPSP
jgi:hypothetical protein